MLIRYDRLRRVAEAVLGGTGSTAEEAVIVAEHLVRANLTGHDSHGVGMIPYYVRFLGDGLLVPNTAARRVRDDGAILAFDGDRGYGQRVAREAMDAAIERCAETGVVLMTLRSSCHIGRIGSYGEQALAAGYVSIHFVNVQDHPPLLSPFRGGDARFGTNPICVAVPGSGRTETILLDMATSKIALGKARVAMNKGELVVEGRLIDHRGRPTSDPSVMFAEERRGALLPIGEHKGYGLALACELLAGVLSGGGTIEPGRRRQGSIVNNMLSFVIDPGRLVDLEWMRNEIDAMVAYARDSPPVNPEEPVLVAGEPERQSASDRMANGIPVDDTTWSEIRGAAETVGLSSEQIEAWSTGSF
ncbi:MAG: malate/lactate/ureidoglycolate dehydrogenase [bacterium]|nr:malate/lactate/ureidoglycolate dehydrogenase [bacterium]